MGIWDRFRKTEQKIRKRVEHALGAEKTRTPAEVYREILEQMESKIKIEPRGKVFPYGKVKVSLQQLTRNQYDAFDSAYRQNDLLKTNILQNLKETQTRYPDELEIDIELLMHSDPEKAESSPGPSVTLWFLKQEPLCKDDIPETTMVVSKGLAEQPAYPLKKERILIGSSSEVLDREGRMVRRNDVVFLDNGDDINSTVGIIHARIWFDFEKREFRIMDEASRYGTRIVRDGRSIDVPSGSDRGIRLQSGDEIYCGQACLRFELPSRPKTA